MLRVFGAVLERGQAASLKLLQLCGCDAVVWPRTYLLRGTGGPGACHYISFRGFPEKCSAFISVCEEILLSGQRNK